MAQRLNLLVDAHAVLWLLDGSPRLGNTAREAIHNAARGYVSAASAWEITTKHRIGRLDLQQSVVDNLESMISNAGLFLLPISFEHASLSGRLDIDHADPFDLMLIAQPLAENLVLVSNEKRFDAFGVKRLW